MSRDFHVKKLLTLCPITKKITFQLPVWGLLLCFVYFDVSVSEPVYIFYLTVLGCTHKDVGIQSLQHRPITHKLNKIMPCYTRLQHKWYCVYISLAQCLSKYYQSSPKKRSEKTFISKYEVATSKALKLGLYYFLYVIPMKMFYMIHYSTLQYQWYIIILIQKCCNWSVLVLCGDNGPSLW